MNKLNETGSANLKVLGESELSQVVGGRGYNGRGNGNYSYSVRRGGNGGNGGNGGGQQSSLDRILDALFSHGFRGNVVINVVG